MITSKLTKRCKCAQKRNFGVLLGSANMIKLVELMRFA